MDETRDNWDQEALNLLTGSVADAVLASMSSEDWMLSGLPMSALEQSTVPGYAIGVKVPIEALKIAALTPDARVRAVVIHENAVTAKYDLLCDGERAAELQFSRDGPSQTRIDVVRLADRGLGLLSGFIARLIRRAAGDDERRKALVRNEQTNQDATVTPRGLIPADIPDDDRSTWQKVHDLRNQKKTVKAMVVATGQSTATINRMLARMGMTKPRDKT